MVSRIRLLLKRAFSISEIGPSFLAKLNSPTYASYIKFKDSSTLRFSSSVVLSMRLEEQNLQMFLVELIVPFSIVKILLMGYLNIASEHPLEKGFYMGLKASTLELEKEKKGRVLFKQPLQC